MQWILIVLGILLAVVAVFALQNPVAVTIRFLNFEAEASVLVVILVSFAAGVFSGILALLPSSIRKSGRVRRMGSELRALEKERAKEAKTFAHPVPAPGGAPTRAFREAEAAAAPARDTVVREPGPAGYPAGPEAERPGPLPEDVAETSDRAPAAPGPGAPPASAEVGAEEPPRRGLGRFFR